MSYTYIITYSYGQEKYLPEFITYYSKILKFDKVIIVEDVENNDGRKIDMSQSKYKKICEVFGDNVIYDYHIRHNTSHYDSQTIVVKKWINNIKWDKATSLTNDSWLLYVDVDEFLNLHNITIKQFLNKYNSRFVNNNGISFMQQLFGHNGINKHNITDLVIDTHRKSVKFELKKQKWFSKSWNKHCFEQKKKGESIFFWNWPRGLPPSNDNGFKAMYRLAKVNEGWIHPGTIHKNKTITVHHDIANINHYCIISKEDINSHYETKKNKLRECISIDLEKDAKVNSDLFKMKKKILSCSEYHKALLIL